MTQVSSLWATLGLDNTKFMSGLKASAGAADAFNAKMNKTFSKDYVKSTGAAAKATSDLRDNMSKNFKDIGRIVQGILVSQMFYKGITMFKSATQDIIGLSAATEDARVSFGLLFRDVAKADRFLGVLEDFAAVTPFSVESSRDASKRLIAMGFEAENIIPTLTSLSDAAALTGKGEEALMGMTDALGKMKTLGRVNQRQLMQLATAGIPVYDILQEKLKLTQKELANIGNLQIPAEVGINAILEGINERYGGASELLSKTMTGQWNKLSDNMRLIGRDMFEGPYNALRDFVGAVGDKMYELRQIMRDTGLGGVFENIIPPRLHDTLRLFLANVKFALSNMGEAARQAGVIMAAAFEQIIVIANMVLPPINALARMVLMVTRAILSSSPVVRMFVGVLAGLLIAGTVANLLVGLRSAIAGLAIAKAAAGLISFLAQAIQYLAIAIISNPLMGFLGLVAGIGVVAAASSKRAKKAFEGIGNSISKAFGYNKDDILMPEQKQNTADANEFNKALVSNTKDMKKFGDEAKKAGKKAREALMSFDEVFTLKDPLDGADPGGLDDLEDMEFPSMPSIDIDDFELPDMGEAIDTWAGDFANRMKTALKNALIGAALGALIGGIIGGAIGGIPGAILGAKIGAFAGGLAGMFWDAIEKAFGEEAVRGIKMGALLGALIGGLFWGPLGAAIGALVGGALGGVVGFYWEEMVKIFGETAMEGVKWGAIIGAIIGGIFWGPLGMALGAAVGGGLGGVIGYFWEELKEIFKGTTGEGAVTGAWIGAMIGGFFWGPLGLALGGVIGGALGTVVGHFWEDIVEVFKKDEGKGIAVGATLGGIIGGIMGGPLGAVLGTLLGAAVGGALVSLYKYFDEWVQDTDIKLKKWQEETKQRWETWKTDTVKIFTDWKTNTLESLSTWYTDSKEGIKTWGANTLKDFQEWWKDTTTGFSSWATGTVKGFTGWVKDSKGEFATWVKDTAKGFGDWWEDTKKVFDGGWETLLKDIGVWVVDSVKALADWGVDTLKGFGNWVKDSTKSFTDWQDDNAKKFSGWVTDTSKSFTTWATDTGKSFVTWVTDTGKGFSDWRTNNGKVIADWTKDTWKEIGDWAGGTLKDFQGWWRDSARGFTDWGRDVYDDVTDWFGRLGRKLKDFFEDLKFWKREASEEEMNVRTNYGPAPRDAGGRGRMYSMTPDMGNLIGHAKGGVFNKAHIAKFNEGDKMEAILPVENPSAMAKVRQAIFGGEPSQMLQEMVNAVLTSATPAETIGGDSTPVYVNTLIADERGLRELERRLFDIRQGENARRGQ